MNPENLRAVLEFAPIEPGTIAPGLKGWITEEGYTYCSVCVGRAARRGILSKTVGCKTPLWDKAVVKCDCCGKHA